MTKTEMFYKDMDYSIDKIWQARIKLWVGLEKKHRVKRTRQKGIPPFLDTILDIALNRKSNIEIKGE